jgi:hypothetical protein
MKTNKLWSEEYTAPTLEVFSTVVERGFEASFGSDIDYAGEDNYGEF